MKKTLNSTCTHVLFYREYHMFLIIIIIIHHKFSNTPLIMGTKDLKDFVSL